MNAMYSIVAHPQIPASVPKFQVLPVKILKNGVDDKLRRGITSFKILMACQNPYVCKIRANQDIPLEVYVSCREDHQNGKICGDEAPSKISTQRCV
jgi:hypothetical protein